MDWLEKYIHYRNIKEVGDYIDDVQKLRYLYRSMQYDKMQYHISDLTLKYPAETAIWNTANNTTPQTYYQMYQSAEVFLQAIGVKLLTEKLKP